MGKMILKSAVLGAVIAAASLSATAAHAASATGQAKAKILRQITLTNTSDLQFATVISGATASTVGVSTAGAVTCGANLTCTGTTTAANFDIQGSNNAVVLYSGDANVTLTGNLGGTMTAALSYSGSGSLTLNAGPGTVGGSFQVGGTLNVGSNQNSGDYTGTFNVTANYQ
jgi:Mat/Ecp fimbriae major subunit